MAMSTEGLFSIPVASVVEEVLRQHGTRLSDSGLASRKAEEAASRRYEAASWLRKTVGVVGAKDLPEQPSEEEFRLGLRNGLILCNALNKVQPGAVPKVVVNPGDSVILPDGAALSAYQYFENVRNFLVALEGMGLPLFEASDLEQGGKSARVVNCVLSLKSCSQWKEMGGNGSGKYRGSVKPCNSGKYLTRAADPFTSSFSRSQSLNEKLQNDLFMEPTTTSHSLKALIRAILLDKKPEEVPLLLESVLSKVMEEVECRIASQNELVQATMKDLTDSSRSFLKQKVSAELASTSCIMKATVEEDNYAKSKSVIGSHTNSNEEDASSGRLLKHSIAFDQQHNEIQELKQTLSDTKAGVQLIQMKYSEDLNNLGKYMYGLAHAASGYHKVFEENRKLYNQVQDLKGNIRVYCRVRPFLPGRLHNSTIGTIDEGNITIITPSKYGKEGCRSFNFNKVFGPSATQEEVFSDTRPLIRSVLDGYNVCIFAYGQTGSGKTFTMTGPKDLHEQSRGVNYRALADLFYLSEQRRGAFCYEIAVQMIEIYNEQVRDLLVTDGLKSLNKRLEIRNSSQKGLNVPDAILVPVASTSDVIELMNIGQKNRAVGATALNDRSSRSHSCLTIHVQGRDMTSGAILRGCMHLVDLAGSERVDKSEVTGERLKEAQHINRSLSALGDVIAALAQKNSHVPYRNSKLAQLLQDSLGGQAKTLMFVHISPEMDAIGETISTLKFAERVSTVELGAARANKESAGVKELKDQIATLKAALARRGGESDKFPSLMSSANTGAPSTMYQNHLQGSAASKINHRHPMEEVGNVEVRNSRALRQKKASFDLQELLGTDPPPWLERSPRLNTPTDDFRGAGPGDWVDKIMVNRHESASIVRDNNSSGDFDGDNEQLPDFFYQRYISDTRYPDQKHHQNTSGIKESHEFDMPGNQFDAAVTDDSDELDIETSDSSEHDMLWQFNMLHISNTSTESASSIKKLRPKPAKSPQFRTPSHANIPSSSRKVSSNSGHAPNQPGRLPVSGSSEGKRGSSGGKMASKK